MKWKLSFAMQNSNHNQSSTTSILPKIIDNKSIPTYTDINTQYLQLIDNYEKACRINIMQLKPLSQISLRDQLILNTIDQISKRNDIELKPADKNLGIVVMSRDDYLQMCQQILNDQSTYQLVISTDYTEKAFQQLVSVLRSHDVLYSSLQKRKNDGNIVYRNYTQLAKSLLQLYFDNKHLKTSKFYCLPKMHKKPPIVGRPIVSSINSITYHTSIYLQNKLFPIVKKLSTICLSAREIIKDSINLKLPVNSLIVCADVKSLYPSIPIQFGIKAIKEMLSRHRFYSEDEIQLILDLLHWVLTNNYLQFNENIYLQTSGTAMGTPVAVSYSNLTLAYLEGLFLDQISTTTYYYRRYIDDIFAIVDSEMDGNKLISLFNQQCSSIQLDTTSITIDKVGVFLDLKLQISSSELSYCTLSTSIYQKPSNKYLYIPPFSAHSSHLLHNIIKQEIKRYRLYCSYDTDFTNVLNLYRQRLYDRGYQPLQIDQYFKLENIPNRTELLNDLLINKSKSKVEIRSKPIIVVQLPNLRNPLNLRETFKIPSDLATDIRYKLAYIDSNIIIGRKNNRSLGMYLLHRPTNTIGRNSLHRGVENPPMEGTTAL